MCHQGVVRTRHSKFLGVVVELHLLDSQALYSESRVSRGSCSWNGASCTQHSMLTTFFLFGVPCFSRATLLLSSAKALLLNVDDEVFVSPHGEDSIPQNLQVWACSRLLLGSASHDSLAWSVLKVLAS